jgi:hypothetical protein
MLPSLLAAFPPLGDITTAAASYECSARKSLFFWPPRPKPPRLRPTRSRPPGHTKATMAKAAMAKANKVRATKIRPTEATKVKAN